MRAGTPRQDSGTAVVDRAELGRAAATGSAQEDTRTNRKKIELDLHGQSLPLFLKVEMMRRRNELVIGILFQGGGFFFLIAPFS